MKRPESARGAASVSSSAVQLAKKIFGSLNGRKAMVLGAGDVAAIALECLRSEGVRVSIVANRTYERAEALAARSRRGRDALRRMLGASSRGVDVLVMLRRHPPAHDGGCPTHRAGDARHAAIVRSAFSTSRCRAMSKQTLASSRMSLY